VAAVQKSINDQQPIRYRLIVQRVSVDVVGPETEPNPSELLPQVDLRDPASPEVFNNVPATPDRQVPE
jgi:hypothetical protein